MALRALRAITIGLYEFCMFYEHRFANPLLLNIVKKKLPATVLYGQASLTHATVEFDGYWLSSATA